MTRARLTSVLLALLLLGGQRLASAEPETADPEHAPRRPDATWAEIFTGPFPTSRLFAMPTAEVVGAYQLSLSGDASLVNEANVLSSSGVAAIGFGDIAQLEYRASNAITTLADAPIRLPTLGVQLKVPLRERKYLPQFAVALRFGFPTEESAGELVHHEQATDLYLVGRLKLWGPFDRFKLHGGLRVSSAEIVSDGPGAPADVKHTLWLPAGGWEVQMTPRTVLAGELALVPLFDPGDDGRGSKIRSGIFGRAGIRWHILPAVVFDASVGYRIEVLRLGEGAEDLKGLIDWDIRLGGEVFLPWGAALCRTARLFCE